MCATSAVLSVTSAIVYFGRVETVSISPSVTLLAEKMAITHLAQELATIKTDLDGIRGSQNSSIVASLNPGYATANW